MIKKRLFYACQDVKSNYKLFLYYFINSFYNVIVRSRLKSVFLFYFGERNFKNIYFLIGHYYLYSVKLSTKIKIMEINLNIKFVSCLVHELSVNLKKCNM